MKFIICFYGLNAICTYVYEYDWDILLMRVDMRENIWKCFIFWCSMINEMWCAKNACQNISYKCLLCLRVLDGGVPNMHAKQDMTVRKVCMSECAENFSTGRLLDILLPNNIYIGVPYLTHPTNTNLITKHVKVCSLKLYPYLLFVMCGGLTWECFFFCLNYHPRWYPRDYLRR